MSTIIEKQTEESKLAQFNLFFEYDSSVAEIRKGIRQRIAR